MQEKLLEQRICRAVACTQTWALSNVQCIDMVEQVFVIIVYSVNSYSCAHKMEALLQGVSRLVYKTTSLRLVIFPNFLVSSHTF